MAKEAPETYWKTSTDLPSFPALQEDTECDITIIGGGITGITTAYELTKRGFRVVLIKANQVLKEPLRIQLLKLPHSMT